jgi:hypothetical protein
MGKAPITSFDRNRGLVLKTVDVGYIQNIMMKRRSMRACFSTRSSFGSTTASAARGPKVLPNVTNGFVRGVRHLSGQYSADVGAKACDVFIIEQPVGG